MIDWAYYWIRNQIRGLKMGSPPPSGVWYEGDIHTMTFTVKVQNVDMDTAMDFGERINQLDVDAIDVYGSRNGSGNPARITITDPSADPDLDGDHE